MLYRFFNLLLAPIRMILFLVFGFVGLLFVPFDVFIFWPLAYLLFNRKEPFFVPYYEWFIDFVFRDWI